MHIPWQFRDHPRWMALAVIVASSLISTSATASGVSGILGSPSSTNAHTASVFGQDPSVAGSNPALLPWMDSQFAVSFVFAGSLLNIDYGQRPAGVDITSAIYGARRLMPDGTTVRLDDRVLPTEDLHSRRGSTDPASNSFLAGIGLSVPLIPRRVVLGFQALVPLTGNWAVLHVVHTATNAPLIGMMLTTSRAVLLWEMVQTDDVLSFRQTACDLTLESDSDLASTVIPPSFIAAISPVTLEGHVDWDAQPPTFEQFESVETHGIVLEDAFNDPLPLSADDSRIVDGDLDGFPGLTVFVTGIIDGAIFVIQRDRYALLGTILDDHISGTRDWNQEQVILGSDNPILEANPPSAEASPDKSLDYFVAIPVAPGTTCDELRESWHELFGE